MNWLFIVSFIVTLAEISSYVEKHVIKYFSSDIVRRSNTLWQKHRISYQNTLSVAMQESYGSNGMNIYIKRPTNPFHVSTGYYHTDNQVHIVLQDMNLDEFPRISDPKISFALPSNVIKLEAPVSKMFIHTNYILFRNTSNIVYNIKDQDPYKTSPFLFEQVQNTGQLAITLEGCKLSGIGITSLIGRTVSLGNTVFRLLNCQFNLEIFTPGVDSPPVIANYLPNSEGLSLEHLVMKPLEAELVPKLQAALHTFVNTSDIFLDLLPELRLKQDKIFEQVTNYINNVMRNLNVLTINRNLGKVMIEDLKISWKETFGEGSADCLVSLHDMVLTGLETVYSSHTGGPFKLTTIKVSEEMRFGTLQVRGSIDFQVGEKTKGMYDFAVEINDVDVSVTCNIQADNENDAPTRTLHTLELMGWRSLQFSSPGMKFVSGEALITGYLLTKLPTYLTNHLNALLGDAVREADNEYINLRNLQAADNTQLPDDKHARSKGYIDDGSGNAPVANLDDVSNGPIGNEDYVGNEPNDNVDNGNIGVVPGGNLDYGRGNAETGMYADYGNGNVNGEQGNLQAGNLNAVPLKNNKLFKDNMFSNVRNQNPSDPSQMLRRKKMPRRKQKQHRSRKNAKKNVVRKVTRTKKSSRSLNDNEIHSDK